MGVMYDHDAEAVGELRRRAELLLRSGGVISIHVDGTRSSEASTPLVHVLQRSEGQLAVSYLTDCWMLIYVETIGRFFSPETNSYRYERKRVRQPDFVYLALEHLRSIQILDDLANT